MGIPADKVVDDWDIKETTDKIYMVRVEWKIQTVGEVGYKGVIGMKWLLNDDAGRFEVYGRCIYIYDDNKRQDCTKKWHMREYRNKTVSHM